MPAPRAHTNAECAAIATEIVEHLEHAQALADAEDQSRTTIQQLFEALHTATGLTTYARWYALLPALEGLRRMADERLHASSEEAHLSWETLTDSLDQLIPLFQELAEQPSAPLDDRTLADLETLLKEDAPQPPTTSITAKPASTARAESPPDVDPEFLARFEEEAADLLESTEHYLLRLEQTPTDRSLVNEAFRSIHSLKGNAGFLGLRQIEQTAGAMESVLEGFRTNTKDIQPSAISALLDKLEHIRLLIAPKASSEGSGQATSTSPSTQRAPSIRVDTVKLDTLFNLVGELITVENMISNNPDLEGLELPNLNKASGLLAKLTRELQEVTLAIRMLPISVLFQKMERLVRDVSRKFNKKVAFEVYGQATEVDKNIIEAVSDPLVHILRNAIDHGIESPAQRHIARKQLTGRVRLGAHYQGNEVIITVEDDGAGLSRTKILAKAERMGMLQKPAETMTDSEVWSLIFEPGFTTAAKVTDVSGRGVGMDVVRQNIEKLHGSIRVESKEGKGSRFTLRLPLTLAITNVMLVRVGAMRYAIPILAIRESFRPTEDALTTTMDGLEVVHIRDQFFPIIRLHERFGVRPTHSKLTDGILMIVGTPDKQVAFLIDEILGQQQAVMKGLSNYIGRVQGVTGCIVLHDGTIALTLDVDSLMNTIPLEAYAD